MVTDAGRPGSGDAARDDLDRVALGLLWVAPDTRAARLFQEQVAPELGPAVDGAPPPFAWALERLTEVLEVPRARRAVRIAEARARAADALKAAGNLARPVSVLDAAYPDLLRRIVDPPLVLWVRGTLPATPAVAVVGSRNATAEGLANARRLSRGLAEAGLVVVSGLARGIDGAAHRGALDGEGCTVAVLGSGPDVIYPAGHAGLAADVLRQGAIVSEYPPGAPPLTWRFPLRNRVISGLSRAVLVVQAGEKSGSLITARAALEQGRDVLAVPGGIASGCHRGCHGLIKDGARLVETVEDILDEIGWTRPGPTRESAGRAAAAGTGLALQMTPGEPLDVEQLAARTGRAVPELLAELAVLEMQGSVQRLAGGRFVRLD